MKLLYNGVIVTLLNYAAYIVIPLIPLTSSNIIYVFAL